MIDGLSCVTLDLQIGKQTSRSESINKKKKKKGELEKFHVRIKTVNECCWTMAVSDSQRWSTT